MMVIIYSFTEKKIKYNVNLYMTFDKEPLKRSLCPLDIHMQDKNPTLNLKI